QIALASVKVIAGTMPSLLASGEQRIILHLPILLFLLRLVLNDCSAASKTKGLPLSSSLF
ncbi:MAG TPA: hypothetical protein PKE54_09465, partial [Candidatus Obscuribacter sp.]|nr:hypothetical protein [Candidatus Obscuribacter sp.]